MVEVAGEPLLTRCFSQLRDSNGDESILVGYTNEAIISHYGDSSNSVSIDRSSTVSPVAAASRSTYSS